MNRRMGISILRFVLGLVAAFAVLSATRRTA